MSILMFIHSKKIGVRLGHIFQMLNGKTQRGKSNESFVLSTVKMLRHKLLDHVSRQVFFRQDVEFDSVII